MSSNLCWSNGRFRLILAFLRRCLLVKRIVAAIAMVLVVGGNNLKDFTDTLWRDDSGRFSENGYWHLVYFYLFVVSCRFDCGCACCLCF